MQPTFDASAFATPAADVFGQGLSVDWSPEPSRLPLIVALPLIAVVSASLWAGAWRLVAAVIF